MNFLIVQVLSETHRAAELHVTCVQGMLQLKPHCYTCDVMGSLFGCQACQVHQLFLCSSISKYVIRPRGNTGTDIREMIMATCIDCGKKISKFFGRSNLIEGKLICGKCDDKRREKERMEAKETKRAEGK